MSKAYDIFISYSRKDSDLVEPFVKELDVRGFKVWIDTSNIDYNETFPDRIAKAMDESACVLFFCSENAIESKYCIKELKYARKNKIEIFAILLKEYHPSKGWFALEFNDVNCVDLASESQKVKLIDSLEVKFQPEKVLERMTDIEAEKAALRQRIKEEEQARIRLEAQKAVGEKSRKRLFPHLELKHKIIIATSFTFLAVMAFYHLCGIYLVNIFQHSLHDNIIVVCGVSSLLALFFSFIFLAYYIIIRKKKGRPDIPNVKVRNLHGFGIALSVCITIPLSFAITFCFPDYWNVGDGYYIRNNGENYTLLDKSGCKLTPEYEGVKEFVYAIDEERRELYSAVQFKIFANNCIEYWITTYDKGKFVKRYICSGHKGGNMVFGEVNTFEKFFFKKGYKVFKVIPKSLYSRSSKYDKYDEMYFQLDEVMELSEDGSVISRSTDYDIRELQWLALSQASRYEAKVIAPGLYEQYKTDERFADFLATYYNNEANELADKGRRDEAIEKLDMAISICPDNPLFYYAKAKLFIKQYKRDKAKEMWEAVMKLDPNFLKNHPEKKDLSPDLTVEPKADISDDDMFGFNLYD